MKIGNKLRKLREFHNYTQEYIASNINISPSQYCKYEKDETPITVDTVEKIAAVYKITYLDLLNWDEKNVFNFHNNNIANGIVETQNLTENEGLKLLIEQLKNEISFLKGENGNLWKLVEGKNSG